LNSYICFYKNFRFECDAFDEADALHIATKHFRVETSKARKITIRLKQRAA
jgi:hypothetical protein